MEKSQGKGKVWHSLGERGQQTWPEASKRIREGGDAVRERERARAWIILCLKEWVFDFCFRQVCVNITFYCF